MADQKPPDLDASGKPIATGQPPDIGGPSTAAKPSSNEALSAALTAHLLPIVHNALLDFATNPQAWKTGKVLGEIAGGVGGGASAVASGNPLAVIPAIGAGAWGGAKAGWRLTNLAQKLAGPLSDLAKTIAPTMNKFSGVQGALDLAQMSDPNRQDIGTLGIGGNPTFPPRTMMVDGRPTLVTFNKDATKMTDSQGNDLAGKKITAMPGAK